MSKTIWFDADGVLLDYTAPFLQYIKSDKTYDTLYDYDLTKLFYSREACEQAMLAFAMSAKFGHLDALADKFDLECLRSVGYTLKVITMLPAPISVRAKRVRNLVNLYGNVFSDIVFTTRNQCKLEYLKSIQGDEEFILVEDNPKLLMQASRDIELAATIGDLYKLRHLEVIGIEHPYNRGALNSHDCRYISKYPDVSKLVADLLPESCHYV